MATYEGPLFDADNHYYEAHDAFTRHVPKKMWNRCVRWTTLDDGRKFHLVGGKLDRQTGNPTFDPISKPGVLRELYRGNPRGVSSAELVRGSLEPMPPEYMDRDARLARLDEQGLESTWLFPTLGMLYEEPIKRDIGAVCAMFEGFNRWLDEDWGFNHADRIFTAPYMTLADVDWACGELEWALERGARTIVVRPSAVWTRNGPRNPGDPVFDPFWARVNEAGIPVVAHVGSSNVETHDYDNNNDVMAMRPRPSVANFHRPRAINDWLASMTFDLLFERFPNLRVASVENGAEFVGDLLRVLDKSRQRQAHHYGDDPVDSFREHVWINPFWEDDMAEVVGHMGADRVIFGSDWPHMEGMEEPRDIFKELEGISVADQEKILYANAAGLNEPRPA